MTDEEKINQILGDIPDTDTEILESVSALSEKLDGVTEKIDNIPQPESIDLSPLESKLDEIIEISKKKDEFDLSISPELRKKLKGDSYTLTTKDKAEIASKIKVPIVKEITHEIPIVTEIVNNIENKETPEETRDKLSSLKGEERLDKKHIKGLDTLIDKPVLDRAIGILDQRTQFLINKQSTSSTPTLPSGTTEDIQFNTGGSFDSDTGKFIYDKSINKLSNLADYGSELAPTLTASNWTTTSGWTVDTSPDVLNHGTTGVGVIQPSASTFVVAGTRYKITITMGEITTGAFSISIGANPDNSVATPGTNLISADGTYTFYIQAVTTAKFQVAPTPGTSRGKVTALSIVAMTDDTGNANFEGNVELNNIKQNGAKIHQRVGYVMNASVNNLDIGNVGWLEALPISTYAITGMVSNHGDGETIYITNRASGSYFTLSHQSGSSSDANRFAVPFNADMIVHPGEVVKIQYKGGNLNKWIPYKISINSAVLSSTTTFDSYLSQFVINNDDMLLGVGKSQLRLHNTTGISALGDVDNNSENTKVEVNDIDKTIVNTSRTGFYVNDKYADEIVIGVTHGLGTFADRYTNINSKTLISDDLEGNPTATDNSLLFEVRSEGNDVFRGSVPAPVMTQTNRDAISSPVEPCMIYNLDTHKYNFWDANASAWQEITSTTAP